MVYSTYRVATEVSKHTALFQKEGVTSHLHHLIMKDEGVGGVIISPCASVHRVIVRKCLHFL